MKSLENFKQAKQKIQQLDSGFVFAYPTEAVYGLGCNPFDIVAVNRILAIKQRPASQRFLLIASDWHQIESLIQPIEPSLLMPVKNSWPGPMTWVFPATNKVPSWLVSDDNSIALRITAHPVASQLCQIAGIPLVSTSANISGEPPCRTHEETKKKLGHLVDEVIEGFVDLSANPTPIKNVLTGEFLRY